MEKVGKLFEDYAKAAWNLARALSRTAKDADDMVQNAFPFAGREGYRHIWRIFAATSTRTCGAACAWPAGA